MPTVGILSCAPRIHSMDCFNFEEQCVTEEDQMVLEEEEAQDTVMDLGFTKELIDEIRESKSADPGMFVSAWEEDDAGVSEKNPEDPVDVFLSTAEEGLLEQVRILLKAKPELLNACDSDGYTALHRAAYNNHVDVVSFLLERGADSEAKTNDGWTPLLSAANWANYDVIGRLLSHGVDANAISNGKVTALHLAINSQSDEPENILHCIRYLLQAPGIDAGVASGSGDTPLMLARRTSRPIYELIDSFLNR